MDLIMTPVLINNLRGSAQLFLALVLTYIIIALQGYVQKLYKE